MTANSARSPRPSTCEPSGRARLLIADDDRVVQTALYMQLNRDFEIVGGAYDADEAISLAEEHQPEVAIIDVQMPGGGGLRATREIRARAPGTAIVALSADESDSVVLAMLEAGAMAYLRKASRATSWPRPCARRSPPTPSSRGRGWGRGRGRGKGRGRRPEPGRAAPATSVSQGRGRPIEVLLIR